MSSIEALAHIRPYREQKGYGRLTLLPSGQTHRWRPSDNTQDIGEGLYEVEIGVSVYERDGQERRSYYLNHASACMPTSGRMLGAYVQSVTAHANKILEALDLTAPVEELLEEITDPEFLTEIHGIGSATAERLIEKIGSFNATELELFSILRSWNISYTRGNKREQWARLYYERRPEELEELRENPYQLLRIASVERLSVRRVAQETDARILGYTLNDIDEAVCETDDRWQTHRYRIVAYLEKAMEKVIRRGHTVAEPSDLRQALRRMDITHISDELGGPTRRLTEEEIDRLVEESVPLQHVSYVSSTGETRHGVTTRQLFHWQRIIRSGISRLARSSMSWDQQEADELATTALNLMPFTPTREQKMAIRHAFSCPVSAVTGPAGAGKTSTVQAYIRSALQLLTQRTRRDPLQGDKDVRTAFCLHILAPTGAASQRIRQGLSLEHPVSEEPVPISARRPQTIQETTHLDEGFVTVSTMHSFLGYRGPGFGYNPPSAHPCILFVDEASMCDEEIMFQLMRFVCDAKDAGAPVILFLTGDVNQLPPVGPGFPFRDILGLHGGSRVPTTKLTKVHRQGGGSMIKHAAHQVLDQHNLPSFDNYRDWGRDPLEQDFWWNPSATGGDINTVLDHYVEDLKLAGKDVSISDIQVILPLRNPSSIDQDALCVNQANETLQARFIREEARKHITYACASREDPDRIAYQTRFAEGDRVVHVGENGYHADQHDPIMRGSIGYITEVWPEELRVQYPWMGQTVVYEGPTEVNQLNLAYAVTTHAAQGSAFEYVLLAVPNKGGPTLVDQSWLYTALTRASKHLQLYAPKRRVVEAIQTNRGMNRQTLLAKTLG